MTISAEQLINLDAYPIHQDGAARDHLVADVQTQLADDGCAVLKGFLKKEAISHLTGEADAVAHLAYHSVSRTNPYFTTDDETLPINDPRRRFFDRSNGFVAAGNFAKTGPLRMVHDFPAFDPFVQECLCQNNFYRYADPLADVVINVAGEGGGFPWHFDTNNFTITLAIQSSDVGGFFEYAPNIRRDGENFDEVQAVLDGTSDKVRTLVLEPGDLQLFKGRYSLHRVAPLCGTTPRYVAIFSYVEQPDMVGSPERTKQLYGRVLPILLARAGKRQDTYID